MNKISLMLLGAMGLAFTACDSFDMPNPPAQSNPQEPIFEAADVELISIAGTQTYNLEQLNTANGVIELAQIESAENIPSAYPVLTLVGQVSASNSFNDAVELPVTITDNVVTVNPDDLSGAISLAFSTIDPKIARTANIRFKAYGYNADGKSYVRLGGEDTYYCPMTVSATPLDPGFAIEDSYYLIGTISGGQISKAVKMEHEGVSPYDNPVFTMVVDITDAQAAAGYEWAIVPASTFATGTGKVYAPASAAVAEGELKTYDAPGTFGKISAANRHLISVNMKDVTYSWMLAIPCLYTPGNSNGWNHGNSQKLYTDNYVEYQGYVNIDGMFKFTSSDDWSHTNYGFAEEGKLTTDGSAGNINVSQNGLYWATANIAKLTYSLDYITTYGLIGSATPKGWDASTPLTPSADFLTWTATVTLGEGEVKFRANDDWAINLGGSPEFLTPGGDNIPSPGAGTYVVTLNLAAYPYTATFVKK